MRRRRREASASKFIGDTLSAKVEKLMDNRRRLLAPFPVDAQAVYEAGWTQDELLAVSLLMKKNNELFRTGKSVRLMFKTPGSPERRYHIELRLSNDMPMPNFQFRMALKDLPKELSLPIAEWAPKWWVLHMEQVRLAHKVKAMSNVCRTYGQLYRLWPDILSMLDDDGRQKIARARVKSAYPEDVLSYETNEHGDEQGYLKEEFRPAAFEPFTSMIAECLMLPQDDTTEVAKISVLG